MKNLIAAFLMATFISPSAMATQLSTREALAYSLPIALHVLETMESERGEHFTDEEIRNVSRSKEFHKRIIDAIYHQRLQRGPLNIINS